MTAPLPAQAPAPAPAPVPTQGAAIPAGPPVSGGAAPEGAPPAVPGMSGRDAQDMQMMMSAHFYEIAENEDQGAQQEPVTNSAPPAPAAPTPSPAPAPGG